MTDQLHANLIRRIITRENYTKGSFLLYRGGEHPDSIIYSGTQCVAPPPNLHWLQKIWDFDCKIDRCNFLFPQHQLFGAPQAVYNSRPIVNYGILKWHPSRYNFDTQSFYIRFLAFLIACKARINGTR